jgi:ankyrin repeat protein
MDLPPLPPPPQDDDPIITQFKPVEGQWELTEDNIKRIDLRTGETILYNHCQYINTTPLEVYRYLIETRGCDVNAQEKDNDTPLHNALDCFDPRNGDIITCMYLLSQKGVNGDTQGYNSETLLHAACGNINTLPIDVFKFLIETLGCDVNAQDNNNDTPLHLAFRYFNPRNGGDIKTLTYLLTQTNINVNIKDKYGYTILHWACSKINNLPIDIFKVLIETLGCDVYAQNNNKETPLQNALRYFDPNKGGDINVWAYLIDQKNINPNIKGKKGCNLLHLICRGSVGLSAQCDTVLCQIVELIVERCIKQVLDETTP